MNSLPRLLGLVLFVLLVVLTTLLALPLWQGLRDEAPGAGETNSPARASGTSRAARIQVLPQKVSLALSVTALALTIALGLSRVTRAPRSSLTRSPFAHGRPEMDALAKLAKTSVAQGAELDRERRERRRAEENDQLKEHLLIQSRDEKIRMGRDLHDGIIQSLYAIGLTLESVRTLVKTDPTEADRRLEQMRAGLNITIRDVRTYITGLAPEHLRRTTFAQALGSLLADLGVAHAARFDLKIDDEAAARLTPEQTQEVLHIAREAASNALRHGGASVITVRLHQSDREIGLLVQDNGVGFDPNQRRDGGHGMENMHARAEQMGAQLRVTSQPGAGSRVIATLPILQASSVS